MRSLPILSREGEKRRPCPAPPPVDDEPTRSATSELRDRAREWTARSAGHRTREPKLPANNRGLLSVARSQLAASGLGHGSPPSGRHPQLAVFFSWSLAPKRSTQPPASITLPLLSFQTSRCRREIRNLALRAIAGQVNPRVFDAILRGLVDERRPRLLRLRVIRLRLLTGARGGSLALGVTERFGQLYVFQEIPVLPLRVADVVRPGGEILRIARLDRLREITRDRSEHFSLQRRCLLHAGRGQLRPRRDHELHIAIPQEFGQASIECGSARLRGAITLQLRRRIEQTAEPVEVGIGG